MPSPTHHPPWECCVTIGVVTSVNFMDMCDLMLLQVATIWKTVSFPNTHMHTHTHLVQRQTVGSSDNSFKENVISYCSLMPLVSFKPFVTP